ncbi:MAG: hypothetical protein ACLRZZ_12530 [Enterocloster sp.]
MVLVQNVQTCPDCNGTGKVIKEKCPDCYGTGYKTSTKKFKVSIPAGIDNGQSVRMAGRRRTRHQRRRAEAICWWRQWFPDIRYSSARIPAFISTVPIILCTGSTGRSDPRIKTVDGAVEL